LFDLPTLERPNGWRGGHFEQRAYAQGGKEAIKKVARGDSRSCEWVALAGHGGAVTEAAFSADSRWVATTSEDRTARVWATENGELLSVLEGHLRRVNGAAFRTDGRWVVTASDDHTARIWEAAAGKEAFTLAGHEGPVRTAAFSPDGRHVLTASEDGTARLWPVDPLPVAIQSKPRELTREERQRYAVD
jgi:WD40 repeat protein